MTVDEVDNLSEFLRVELEEFMVSFDRENPFEITLDDCWNEQKRLFVSMVDTDSGNEIWPSVKHLWSSTSKSLEKLKYYLGSMYNKGRRGLRFEAGMAHFSYDFYDVFADAMSPLDVHGIRTNAAEIADVIDHWCVQHFFLQIGMWIELFSGSKINGGIEQT